MLSTAAILACWYVSAAAFMKFAPCKWVMESCWLQKHQMRDCELLLVVWLTTPFIPLLWFGYFIKEYALSYLGQFLVRKECSSS